ncbi:MULTISPECIES: hypothetical protein [Providencia]|nr:hypothetical protein [Providencia stuartii]
MSDVYDEVICNDLNMLSIDELKDIVVNVEEVTQGLSLVLKTVGK